MAEAVDSPYNAGGGGGGAGAAGTDGGPQPLLTNIGGYPGGDGLQLPQ